MAVPKKAYRKGDKQLDQAERAAGNAFKKRIPADPSMKSTIKGLPKEAARGRKRLKSDRAY